MDTKLTLSLEQTIIENAKEYASVHKISLSKLIENYLLHVTEGKKDEIKISPLVKSLSHKVELPHDYDEKKDYRNYLNGKYNK